MAMVRFGDVAERINTKEDRFKTDLVYYVGGDHIETGEIRVTGRGVIKEADLGPMFYFGFKPDDILFVTRNPHLRKSAKVDFAGICSEKTLVIATKDERVLLQDYLASVMQSDDFWNFMEENKSGSVNYFVNWSTLADYEFDLPPLPRQRELAELLWAANDLKEAYKKAITATDEMLKAKFNAEFGMRNAEMGDGAHEGAEPQGKWPMVNLGMIGKVCMCKRVLAAQTKDTGDIPFYKISTFGGVADSYISYELYSEFKHKYSFPKKGDILLSAAGTIGRCVVYDGEPAYFQDSNIVWLDNDETKVANPFLLLCYRYISWQTTKGGIIERLYNDNIRKAIIPLPPLSLQREFVAIAEKAEAAKASLKQSISTLDQVMKGLINEN